MYKLQRIYGIFSDFNRVLDWLWYSKYTNQPVYVDWREDDKNLFEDIFTQKYQNQNECTIVSNFVEREPLLPYDPSIELRRKSVPFYEKYVGDHPHTKGGYFWCTPEVYKEQDFFILRKEFNSLFDTFLKFKESFFKNNEQYIIKNNFFSKKVLGVHLRWPGHYYLNQPNGIPISNTIQEQDFFILNAQHVVDYFNNNNFDFIYLATDCEIYSNILNNLLPNKIIQLPYKRVNNDAAYNFSSSKNNTHQEEINNVFLDVYNLSTCDHFISAAGNITFGVCILNPNLKYHLYPLLQDAYTG
jgi:hypothetical protein